MAAKRRSPKSAVQRQKASETASKLENTAPNREEKDKIIAEYLPPLSLTLIVLVCSGTLFLFCLRDFMVTGKNVAGPIDEAYLVRRIWRVESVSYPLVVADFHQEYPMV